MPDIIIDANDKSNSRGLTINIIHIKLPLGVDVLVNSLIDHINTYISPATIKLNFFEGDIDA